MSNPKPEIQIIKGVPLPPGIAAGGRPAKYPWATMEIDDMFLFKPGYLSSSAPARASEQGLRHGRKFATRKLSPEQLAEMGIESDVPRIGCWRVE